MRRRNTLLLAIPLGLLPWLLAIGLWDGALLGLTFDDSYYYYEIASRLAEGQGFTFDGLHPTNGFHPLWLLICAGAWAMGLGAHSPLVLLALQVLLYGLAMAGVLLVADRAIGTYPRQGLELSPRLAELPLAALSALLIASPFVVRTFANGMESTLVALSMAGTLLFIGHRHPLDLPRAHRLGLGAVLGLAVLARTDAALLCATLGLWCLPRMWREGRRGLARWVELLAIPALVTLGFLLVNHWAFGTPMQVSGSLKRVPISPLRGLWVLLCAGLPWLLVARLHRRADEPTKLPRTAPLLRRTGWMLAFCGLILAYYTGVQTFARLWYFGPLVLYLALLLPVFAADLIEMSLEDAPDKPPARAAAPLIALLLLPLAGGLGLQLQRMLSPAFAASRAANREAGRWISANLPADAVLASWDAGVVAYYSDQPVVNLDGVVNSPAYAEALRSGQTAELLRTAGIDYVVNHDELAGGIASMATDTARLMGPKATDGWHLVQRWPFTFAGSTNDRAAGTHEMAVFLFELGPGY